MNVYDFDNTIYDGDSTIDFYLFCLKEHPSILRKLPIQLYWFVKYKLGKTEKIVFKTHFFSFLKCLSDQEALIKKFWDKKEHLIRKWFILQHKNSDVVISASPEFLLTEICERIGNIYLIASKVNSQTGDFLSANCYGEEKVFRFKSVFGDEKIDEFYSDSFSDKPLADISKKAFLVNKKGRFMEWK